MLSFILCDYNYVYILSKGTITVPHMTQIIGTKKQYFTDCKSERNEEIDHARDIVVVMSVYDLIECSDNYSKTSEIL